MSKTLLSLAALLLLTISLQAQSDVQPLKVKFGKLSDEEIKMTKYDKDPDAPAVVLFDKGYCILGEKKKFSRHVRIKIFKKTAYAQANFAFEFYKNTKVTNIKGVTYNFENGKMTETKLEKESIFEEKITKTLFVEKVTMPGVREGSIVELSYDIDGGILNDWTFQADIPTIWSEYELHVPDYFIFSKIGQGSTPYLVSSSSKSQETLTITENSSELDKTRGTGAIPNAAKEGNESRRSTFSYVMNNNLWIQKDVPAFKTEKFITSAEDYLTRLTFYLEEVKQRGYGSAIKLVKPWKEEAKELLDDSDYYGFIDKKSAFKQELATIVHEGMKPKEKVQAIFNYVGKTFQQAKNRSLFLNGTLSDVLKRGKLAPSEMNLVMLNMLRTAGIEVHPVLISTRDHGKIGTPNAYFQRFDRTIGRVLIEKDTFFIDVASFPHPIDLLPFEDLNGGGYEFWGKDNYALVTLANKIPTRRMSQAIMSLNTEGSLFGTIATTASGYEAVENRKILKEIGADKFAQSMVKGLLNSGKLEEQKFEKPENFDENNLKATLKIKSSDYVSVAGDKIYLNPLLCFGDKGSPFANPERLYDVDYGSPKEDIANLVLTIPEGYKIEELPKMTRLQFGEGAMKYDYLIEAAGNQIKVNTKLSIKKTIYEVENYKDLRDFYSKIIAKMGEQIVLTKVSK